MKSILQDKRSGRCYICEHWRADDSLKRDLEEHHIFYGPNRKLSERYGIKVMLCRYHHQGDIHGSGDAIHNNPDKTNDQRLKRIGQTAWEKKYAKAAAGTAAAHAEFREVFGKSYL